MEVFFGGIAVQPGDIISGGCRSYIFQEDGNFVPVDWRSKVRRPRTYVVDSSTMDSLEREIVKRQKNVK